MDISTFVSMYCKLKITPMYILWFTSLRLHLMRYFEFVNCENKMFSMYMSACIKLTYIWENGEMMICCLQPNFTQSFKLTVFILLWFFLIWIGLVHKTRHVCATCCQYLYRFNDFKCRSIIQSICGLVGWMFGVTEYGGHISAITGFLSPIGEQC